MAAKDGVGFVTMTRAFEADMSECTIAEIGLMSLLITSPATTPLGNVYRRHEWEEFPGSSDDQVFALLEGLESKGKIVRDNHDILIRSWLRHRTFSTPNYLKSCLYPLQVQVRSPLLRTVVATELLRKDVAGIPKAPPTKGSKQSPSRVYTKGRDAHFQALELLWEEITDQKLPPAETITGSVTNPNPEMVEQLIATRDFAAAVPELERRNWVCVHPELAEVLRATIQGPNVAPLRRAE